MLRVTVGRVKAGNIDTHSQIDTLGLWMNVLEVSKSDGSNVDHYDWYVWA